MHPIRKQGVKKVLCTKCGKDAELKMFQTFSYYYCNHCKDEVSATENVQKRKDFAGLIDTAVRNDPTGAFDPQELQRLFEEMLQDAD